MRASIAHTAIVAATIFGVSGCSSGPSWPRFGWWGKKSATESSLASAPAGPQLPSAAAGGNAPLYSPTATATYPEQTVSATAPAYPANSYAGNPAPSYGTSATGAAANPYGSATAQSSVAPQAGPYSSVYGQGTGAAANSYGSTADPYASGSYGSNTTATQQGANYYGPTTTDPNSYRTADSRAGNYASGAVDPGYSAPGSNYSTGSPYDGSSTAMTNAPKSDYRYGDPQATTEAGPADTRYPSTATPEASPTAFSGSANSNFTTQREAYQPGNNGYQPGNTGYQPGNTGYSPPGVPPYQPAYESNAAPQSFNRTDPFYRPGSTSSYKANTAPASQGNASAVVPASYEAAPWAANAGTAGGTTGAAPNNNYAPATGFGGPSGGY